MRLSGSWLNTCFHLFLWKKINKDGTTWKGDYITNRQVSYAKVKTIKTVKMLMN